MGTSLFELVAKAACDLYRFDLPKRGKPAESNKEWTTLASIVQAEATIDTDIPKLTVVALATGTKCMGEKELTAKGDLLCDSHAEVLARRAFLLYLYDQLKMTKNSIFLKQSSSASDTSCVTQFAVRPGIEFHLFISQLPCGDASIFSLTKPEDVDEPEEPERKKAKLENEDEATAPTQNRTGAKIYAGSKIYEKDQEVGKCRIKPGKGNPTLSMSCSDKIAKWQLLGLQGSFLGNFIPEPIRFSSITIGSGQPFNQASLARAVHHRFESKALERIQPFSCPIIFQSQVRNFMDFDSTVKTQPAPASIIWSLDEITRQDKKNVQVSVNGYKQGLTKKFFGTPAARLEVCRKNLFQKFINLSHNCNLVFQNPNLTYSEAKELNSDYKQLWSWLKENVMTGWTDKHKHLTQFDASN